MTVDLDDADRALLDTLQQSLPLVSRPFMEVARRLGISEDEVLSRLRRLLASGVLRRIGPVLSLKAAGGERTLAAMRVSPERLEEAAALVNNFEAVSHNYEREHEYNLWFVVSSDDPTEPARVLREVEAQTGLPVLDLPSQAEYHLGVRFHLAEE